MFSVVSDPRFKQGRKFIIEKSYDDAIEIFESLLQGCVERYGDMSLECVDAYFEYGNALLLKEEENPSGGLLGNVNNDEVNDDQSDDEDGAPPSSNENTGAAAADDDESESADDLQIAWEVIDLARCILEKKLDEINNASESSACSSSNNSASNTGSSMDTDKLQLRLSEVHTRLGDLMKFNSNTAGALEDYGKALEIRSRVCKPHDSLLSEVHFSLAVAYLYSSAEKKEAGEDNSFEKQNALKHYRLSKESIEAWLLQSQDEMLITLPNGVQLSTVIEEKSDLVDQLQETIDALCSELCDGDPQDLKGSSVGGSLTTIGFGSRNVNESCSSASGSSNSGMLGNGSVQMLQVKKKSKIPSSNFVPAAGQKRPFTDSSEHDKGKRVSKNTEPTAGGNDQKENDRAIGELSTINQRVI